MRCEIFKREISIDCEGVKSPQTGTKMKILAVVWNRDRYECIAKWYNNRRPVIIIGVLDCGLYEFEIRFEFWLFELYAPWYSYCLEISIKMTMRSGCR